MPIVKWQAHQDSGSDVLANGFNCLRLFKLEYSGLMWSRIVHIYSVHLTIAHIMDAGSSGNKFNFTDRIYPYKMIDYYF